MIEGNNIKQAIEALGIQRNCICIHSSLKSFGSHIEGGAETILSAFLEEDCTVMVPAFDDDCDIYPPKHLRPERNGTGDFHILKTSNMERRKFLPLKAMI